MIFLKAIATGFHSGRIDLRTEFTKPAQRFSATRFAARGRSLAAQFPSFLNVDKYIIDAIFHADCVTASHPNRLFCG
ncbi:MAG: hypothetical protein AAGU11_08190 [Syntrophobacteraceae bacterium]